MSNTMIMQPIHPPDFYPSSNYDPNKSITYSEKIKHILNHTKSQIIPLNPEDKHTDVKCIMAMNRSIKKLNDLKGEIAFERMKYQSLNNKNLRTSMSGTS